MEAGVIGLIGLAAAGRAAPASRLGPDSATNPRQLLEETIATHPAPRPKIATLPTVLVSKVLSHPMIDAAASHLSRPWQSTIYPNYSSNYCINSESHTG